MPKNPIPAGKLPAGLLSGLLATFRSSSADVRVGPGVGEDACVLDVTGGVVVAATDPITLTTADAGRYAVLINANDVAVTGVQPRWFLSVVLLPVGTTEDVVTDLFTTMRHALDEVGATLVGGHTEVTSAVNQPVVIGQMLGTSADGRFVTSGGAAPGDVVVQIGAAPVEGAAVLAADMPEKLAALPRDVLAAAQHASHSPGISVVDAALAARDLGATAMHDPTEGGIASGLHELAAAAHVSIQIERDQVHWFEPGLRVCRELGADPWATLASGTLLATFPHGVHQRAVEQLTASGHPVAVLGTVERSSGGADTSNADDDVTDAGTTRVVDSSGHRLPWPEHDEVARILSPDS